jgi:DNA-binding PadR family transcriptional regulator
MLTTLDALLLYLVRGGVKSGYDVRALFQTTALNLFSDSPGAIYPALKRLEARGLLASAAEAAGRRKRSYRMTAEGEAQLTAWTALPLGPDDIARRQAETDLRYVIVANVAGPAQARAHLSQRAALEAAELARLEAFAAAAGEAMDRPARESFALGLSLVRTRMAWTLARLAESPEGNHR